MKKTKKFSQTTKNCDKLPTITKKGDDFPMRSFFSRLLGSLARFMNGRYGIDGLFMPIVVTSCVCTLLSSFGVLWFFRPIGTLLLLYALFRACSKNYDKRRQELYRYQKFATAFSKKIGFLRQQYQDRHIRKYFKCPCCKTRLFVPKGKGKIQITCRQCGHKFIKKT